MKLLRDDEYPYLSTYLDWWGALSYRARTSGGSRMVEKTIQLTGTSTNSIEDAVNIAVSRASVTIQSIRQARVLDINAVIENGVVAQWRVKIDLAFAVQDRLHE